jgi:hypothetical protein
VLKKFKKFLTGQIDMKGKPIKPIEETKDIKMEAPDPRKVVIPEILSCLLTWLADGSSNAEVIAEAV